MNRRVFLASALAAVDSAQSIARGRNRRDTDETPEQELLDRISHDPLRPQYHLLPRAGFVGDPCAPRYFSGDGQNHVFFHGSFGGRGWSHAKSADLVHWQHMPKALTPSGDSCDSYGTFTGSVLPGGPGAGIIYTGVTKVPRSQETIRNEGLREVQCIATTTDKDLQTWHKLDSPVIEVPPKAPAGRRSLAIAIHFPGRRTTSGMPALARALSTSADACCSIAPATPARGSICIRLHKASGTGRLSQTRSGVPKCGSVLIYSRSETSTS